MPSLRSTPASIWVSFGLQTYPRVFGLAHSSLCVPFVTVRNIHKLFTSSSLYFSFSLSHGSVWRSVGQPLLFIVREDRIKHMFCV